MHFQRKFLFILLCAIFVVLDSHQCYARDLEANQTLALLVDASPQSGRKIPDLLFGIFFEEINHAGAGGIWAELVNNRGFEAGGQNTPSNIDPWSIIGNETFINVMTDRTSCFIRNKIALRMEILCSNSGSYNCPAGGVGIYNPGYWGMNIEKGKSYKVVLYVKSSGSLNLLVSLTSSDGLQTLASHAVSASASEVSDWKKMEFQLDATESNSNSRLQFTTDQQGVIWLDQVSVMPTDTYKGHGFRKELISMVEGLKPRFIRFPGGCFVEGEWLRNAFRWRESIGPWEERPGHFGDVWMYWTDDGLGYYEFLLLAEDLGAAPVWVFNNGVSHQDEVTTPNIAPFVKDILDSLEFAKGSSNSTWGKVRADMGHPEPFDLKYVAIGNEDCGKPNYRGNYLKFYYAIQNAYPDIKMISNCDGSSHALDHPADLYDFHIYSSANTLFRMANQFDITSRKGPKAFVSEYAVTGKDAGTGSLLAALGEAAFLIGLEKNSDAVEMASYAPLFVNVNDRRWNPDAIVFNSHQQYGTPSYWMQHFFKESSGATYLPSTLQANSSAQVVASAIIYQNSDDGNKYLKIKAVNFGSNSVNLNISVSGLQNKIISNGSKAYVLTSSNLMDENSFQTPNKIGPVESMLQDAASELNVILGPHSINSFDLALESSLKASI